MIKVCRWQGWAEEVDSLSGQLGPLKNKTCSFHAPWLNPPPPQKKTGTYAKPSIFDCRHNPSPSVASTPKAKGSAARENRSSVAMETVCSHLQLYNPPPLSSPPPPPVTLSRFPHHPQPGAEDDSERGGGGGRESLPLEQRLRRWRRRLLNVSGSIVIIALSIGFYNSDDKMVELHSRFCCHTTLLPIVIQKQRIVLRKRSLSKQVSVWGAKIYILVNTPMTHAGKLFGEEFFKNVRDSSQPSFCCRLYISTSPGWQIRR